MSKKLLEGLLVSALIVTGANAALAQALPTEPEVLSVSPPVEVIEEVVPTPEIVTTPERQANTAEINCLARNVYFEARGEGQRGMRAVAHVTMNRTEARGFRKTVCGVVHQPGQFSWVGNGRSPSGSLWHTSRRIAEDVYMKVDVNDPTSGATYFHATRARPDWSRRFTRTITIGNHAFYKA